MSSLPARTCPRLAAAVVAALFAGCPLPQPVPGVQPADGGTLTPPRIASETTLPSATIIHYEPNNAGCDGGPPIFSVRATIRDEKSDFPVEGRWFVDYDPSDPSRNFYRMAPFVSPPQPEGVFDRPVDPPFAFDPTSSWSTETTHVVELVIANAFSADTPDGGLPNRTPAPGNETQVFRWVFVPAPGSGTDGGCGP